MVQECDEWAKLPLELHSFPTVEALATRATEADLRAMGERPALIDSLVDTLRNEWRVISVMVNFKSGHVITHSPAAPSGPLLLRNVDVAPFRWSPFSCLYFILRLQTIRFRLPREVHR